MPFIRFLKQLILLAVVISGCTDQPIRNQSEDISPTDPPGLQSKLNLTPTIINNTTPQKLILWLPEEFDPNLDNPYSHVLQTRLSEFIESHPGIRIETRIKGSGQVGGLIDSLSSYAVAAPLALPDLVLLSRPDLVTAAKQNILHPLDNLLSDPNDADWYDYAASLAKVESQTFGLPFAGDALILAYNKSEEFQPPSSWNELQQLNVSLAFPPADPKALFSIMQYQSLGGTFENDSGILLINEQVLRELFTIYKQAVDNGLFPTWIIQYETDNSVWQSFLRGRSEMAVSWSSRFLASPPEEASAAPLPTRDGVPFTLATGYAWVLTSPRSIRHPIAIELAEYLTNAIFLSEWTAAAGFLPPRPSALALWIPGPRQALASQIIPSAELFPDNDVSIFLGPLLADVIVRLLKGEITVDAAVEITLEQTLQR